MTSVSQMFSWPEGTSSPNYKEFTDIAKALVANYFNSRLDRSDRKSMHPMLPHEPYVVKFSYILGNWKALVSTNIPDGMYYELTYNVNEDEIYLDAYKKVENVQVVHWVKNHGPGETEDRWLEVKKAQ